MHPQDGPHAVSNLKGTKVRKGEGVDLARLRRGVRRGCFVASAGCLALAALTPPAGAQSEGESLGPRPAVFSGAAVAQAVTVEMDKEGLIPVEDVFRYTVADGVGTYRTSEQRGRASLFYPGNGLTQGPALACSQFPPEARPVFGPIVDACLQYSFPLTVTADALEPDGATEGSLALGAPTDPISANGVGARAHAGEDAVTTAAEVSGLRVLGAPAIGPLPAVPGFEDLEPYLMAIGSVTATTDERIDEAGALVVDAVSGATDVRLIGGLVRIGSVVAHARIVDAEGEEPVIEATLDVSGVTVAGMPAQFTEQGLQLAAASAPLGPQLEALTAQLNSTLESVSFQMETLAIEQGKDEDGISFANVGGLMISMGVPVDGLPPVPGPVGDVDLNGNYAGSILIGQAGARALAGSFDDEETTTGGRTGPSPVSPLGGSTGSSSSGGGETAAPAGPAAPTAPAAPEAPADGPVEAITDLFADRLKLLDLAFTLAGLAICIAPRMALPARLPGPPS